MPLFGRGGEAAAAHHEVGHQMAARKVAIIKTILLAAGSLLIAITLLPLIRRDEWIFRLPDFPRVQIAVLILGVLALYPFFARLSFFNGVFYVALLLAFSYQGALILPYTPAAPTQVMKVADGEHEFPSISLLHANVLMSNRDYLALLEMVRREDPDVVLVVEPDGGWEEALRPLEQEYPHTIKEPKDNTYGMILYSRLELQNPEVRYLVDGEVPSIRTRIALPGGEAVLLLCLHPKPPRPPQQGSSQRDAELVVAGKEIRKAAAPVIVLGDLNDVAWSYTTQLFQEISSTLDPRRGRGFYITYPASAPLLGFSLDHVFHSDHFKLRHMRVLPSIGSDHLPILADLVLAPGAARQQEEPAPNAEELREAEQELKDAREQRE